MTRKDWEKHCLKYIIAHGKRVSIFWATDNKFVSNTINRLENKGHALRLMKHKDGNFPWMVYRIPKVTRELYGV